MSKVVIESCENVAIVRLNNGVINAINIEMVDDLSQPAFGFIKENRVRDNHHKFVMERESNKEQFLDCWFQESVRELLGEAANKF